MGTNCIFASASAQSLTFVDHSLLRAPSKAKLPRLLLQSEIRAATPTSSSAPRATSQRTGPRSRANDDGSPPPSASMPEPAQGASQRLRRALCASFSKHPAQCTAPQREGVGKRSNLRHRRGCSRGVLQRLQKQTFEMTTKEQDLAGREEETKREGGEGRRGRGRERRRRRSRRLN